MQHQWGLWQQYLAGALPHFTQPGYLRTPTHALVLPTYLPWVRQPTKALFYNCVSIMPAINSATQTPTPQALYRRLSGFINRTPSLLKLRRTQSLGRALDVRQIIGLRLPSEILDRILQMILESKRSFSLIAAFSLASSDFRQIAFRRFFWSIQINSRAHWESLSHLLGAMDSAQRHRQEIGFLWVK